MSVNTSANNNSSVSRGSFSEATAPGSPPPKGKTDKEKIKSLFHGHSVDANLVISSKTEQSEKLSLSQKIIHFVKKIFGINPSSRLNQKYELKEKNNMESLAQKTNSIRKVLQEQRNLIGKKSMVWESRLVNRERGIVYTVHRAQNLHIEDVKQKCEEEDTFLKFEKEIVEKLKEIHSKVGIPTQEAVNYTLEKLTTERKKRQAELTPKAAIINHEDYAVTMRKLYQKLSNKNIDSKIKDEQKEPDEFQKFVLVRLNEAITEGKLNTIEDIDNIIKNDKKEVNDELHNLKNELFVLIGIQDSIEEKKLNTLEDIDRELGRIDDDLRRIDDDLKEGRKSLDEEINAVKDKYKSHTEAYESLKEIHDMRVAFSKMRNQIELLKANMPEISKNNKVNLKKIRKLQASNGDQAEIEKLNKEIKNYEKFKNELSELKKLKHIVKVEIKEIVKTDIQRGNSLFQKVFIPSGHEIDPNAHYSNEELIDEKNKKISDI